VACCCIAYSYPRLPLIIRFLVHAYYPGLVQVDRDITDSRTSSLDFTDTAAWNKLIKKSAADQAPAAFTPTVAARKEARLPPSVHERDMFTVMAKPVLETIITLWNSTDDPGLISRYIFSRLSSAMLQ
jgi:hypothetical protein